MPDPKSPYGRLNYRRLISWPARIEREWPFLRNLLAQAPAAAVVDLGCGTGEHARYMASQEFRATGLDQSEDQIEAAREYEYDFGGFGPRFLHGEIADLPRLTDERFGAAICLGNVLPHLDDEAMATSLKGLASRLRPGGKLIAQLINYTRVFSKNIRTLPINLRDDPEHPGDEIAFVRLMKRDGDRHVRFYPTTLALRPGSEPPLELKATREVRLRAWTREDLATALERAGFHLDSVHGDMVGGSYEPEESADLVIVAHKI